MNRDKQIEEMAKDIREVTFTLFNEDCRRVATRLYNAGYRKASDVAREIFEEIDSKLILNKAIHCGQKFYYTRLEDDIAELKKKYTEGEG